MKNEEKISEVVKAREILIYDDADRIRMSLNAHGGIEPKLTIYKEDGTPGLEISSMEVDSDSRRITFFGKRHVWRLRITSTEHGVGITVFDQKGKCMKSWGWAEDEH